jgi:hypothetical protein
VSSSTSGNVFEVSSQEYKWARLPELPASGQNTGIQILLINISRFVILIMLIPLEVVTRRGRMNEWMQKNVSNFVFSSPITTPYWGSVWFLLKSCDMSMENTVRQTRADVQRRTRARRNHLRA